MPRSLAALALLLLAMAALPTAGQQLPSEVGEVAHKLERLSKAGMDVSRAVELLNNALALLSKGNLTAEEWGWVRGNLSLADAELSDMEARLPAFELGKAASTAAAVAAYASLPLFVYFALPKIWAYAWYRARRKWLVERRG